MKKTTKEKMAGFTLLELVLVISIIGIMTGVSLVSMSAMRVNAKLRAAQSELTSTIKLAQSYALQGKTLPSGTPEYFGINFYENDSYGICGCLDETCSDGTNDWKACDEKDEMEEKYDFPAGVQLDSFGGKNMTFRVPHGNVLLSASPLIFDLKIAGSGETKTVTVNANGNIIEN